ncbi:MAG: hypothetical protein E6614_17910 [Bradyrhizobium sp.]|nr:hypothetical protein [Bradyrhizobium sp.]
MTRMSLRPMLAAGVLAGLLAPFAATQAAAQFGAPPLQISWEVRNRFRLFREEREGKHKEFRKRCRKCVRESLGED